MIYYYYYPDNKALFGVVNGLTASNKFKKKYTICKDIGFFVYDTIHEILRSKVTAKDNHQSVCSKPNAKIFSKNTGRVSDPKLLFDAL